MSTHSRTDDAHTMRVLRAADYRRMPWKNGGGTTTEIAVSPTLSGLDDFDWRISMARVESGGPFSLFPGIDRTLAILEGEGVVLDVQDGIPTSLTRRSQPFSFAADAPTQAALIGGPVTDLNVMTRRGRTSHTVSRIDISGSTEIEVAAGTNLIFCASGSVEVLDGNRTVLHRHDTLLTGEGPATLRLEAQLPASVFLIAVADVGRGRQP